MNRKDLLREYKDTPRPAGVYRVVHKSSGRTLLGASPDVTAMLNRLRAQLSLGSHPNRQMSADWEADGESGFNFEVLDVLDVEDPGRDLKGELRTLLDLWRENLQIAPEDRY